MLVKKGLLSFAVALPLFSTMASAGGYGNNGIDELRNRCIEFRQNAQINQFNIKILCSGSYTFWESEAGNYTLPQTAALSTHTTCKGNRFQTSPGAFAFDSAPFVGNCARYVKKEMRAPEGGIALNIQVCEDLTQENVEEMCRGQIQTFCADQVQPIEPIGKGPLPVEKGDFTTSTTSGFPAPAPQFGYDGACTLQVVDAVDTCTMF